MKRDVSSQRLLALTVAALLLGACGGVAAQPAPGAPADRVRGDLTVLAASSLTDAFDRAGDQFKRQHPGVSLRFSYAGSSTLVNQIQQGAPADLFASADVPNMQKVVDGGLSSGRPRVFARNRLQIVVQSGNPKQIRALVDLARPSIKVDVCAPAVPCGSYAASVLSRANVRLTPVSQEDNVRAVVTKVSLGEADAGIVYATDVKAGGPRVEGVSIPDDQNVIATYPIVQLRTAQNPAAAAALVDFLTSPRGQRTLADLGFLGAA